MRALHDINRLFLLLQRLDDFLNVARAIRQIRPDDVFAGGTHRHAIGRLVVRPMGEALPHRGGFGLAHAAAIVERVLAVCDLLDPIGEAPHELAIVVGEAGREIEPSVGGDGPDGTGRHAQPALQTGVVIDRRVVFRGLRPDQHGSQQDEVAELGVDDVAVDAHVAEPGGDGDGLVRYDPYGAGELIHLHRKAHRRADGANAHARALHHPTTDFVNLMPEW